MSNKSDWPEYYESNGIPRRPSSEPDRPEWSRHDCITAGQTLAKLFATDKPFGESYLDIVKDYYATGKSGDFTDRYAATITPHISGKVGLPFNAHDFANVHRATWLWLLEGFVRLVNHNPHEPEKWGDPVLGDISRGEEPVPATVLDDIRLFHNVPNSKGYFAINTLDIPPPTVTN